MTAPSSYEVIQVLHSGTSTSVVRAIGADKKMYIIKENSRAVASQKKIQKYFREYTIGSSIKSKNVVKYVDMKRFGYGFAIVQEDIGGASIKQQLPSSGFPLYQFFPIAIEIVHGIADIHAAGVVHRDINPNNIVVNLFLDSLNSIFFSSSTSSSSPPSPSLSPSPTHLSSSSSSTTSSNSSNNLNSSTSSSPTSSSFPSLFISDPSSPHLSISPATSPCITPSIPLSPIFFPSTPFQVKVNIVDFDIASRLSKEEIAASSSHQMQGTLLYMSPEQTGRMNRHIDYRSDFYSLGATFYEMLIGKPPFRHTIDPLELMHKHIAITPKPLYEVKGEIPKALSDVIRKLMAKNAEDRYQDCAGILADLEEIQERLKNNQSLDNYVVGSHDAPHHFQVSQKLYGRSEQTKILTTNFNNISNGQTAVMMMLVHGYSGVGKTTLVNEVHKPLVRDKGYYVYGKFNQYAGNVPYAAFIQALRQLMQQILAESEQKLAKWKEVLLKAVGKNGQIIIDVIPEFEFIIGHQQPVTKLSAVDTQNRFKQVFVSFICSIASKNHPLVIFLDDLQWADTNTLTILTTLLAPPVSAHHLLVLGAYRENEVSADHPFVCTVSDIISKKGVIQDLVLKPLELQDVESLVRDSCFVSNQSSEQPDDIKYFEDIHLQESDLAKEIYAKTEGNPFFINQLLTMLYQDNHIILKATPVPHWICNIEHVKAANYTNNVIDLMVTKLRKTPAVQNVLGIAAQIGNQFDLPLLAGVCGLSIKDALSLLAVPIQENFIVGIDKAADLVLDAEVNGNLILTTSEDVNAEFGDKQEQSSTKKSDGDVQLTKFRFGHDRIQQAAASLVSPKEITEIHLQVAEQLILRFQEFPKKLDDVILFLVNHLNQGLDIESLSYPQPSAQYLPFTSFSVARLNLHAAVKSKNSIAYSQALIYVNYGIEILSKWSEVSWRDCYELTFELHSLKAELLSLLGKYDKAEDMYPTLLQQARSNEDTSAVYLIMYYQYELQTRYDDVLQVARKGLALFGISLPDGTDKEGLEEVYAADVKTIQQKVPTDKDVETLRELPFCSDETSLSVMKLLQAIFLSAYVTGLHALAACVCSRLVVLSIEKGLCEETMMGFAGFGFSVGPYTKDYKYGFKFGKLAILLSDAHYPQTIMRGHVYILFSMYNPWCEPINTTPTILVTAFELSQQTSDLNWAVYAVPYLIEYYFFQGAPLEEAVQVYNKYMPFVKNLNTLWFHYIRGGTQPIRDLIGDPSHFLEGKPFENSEFQQHTWLTVTYYYSKTLSLYYMQQKQDWLTYADQAIVMVPKLFPALYKELEIKVIVPLIYLDWLSRSSLARELYGSNKRTTQIPSPKFHVDTSDVEVEQLLPEDKQVERLNFRLSAIRDSIAQLEHLALSCECNYLHKLLLLRAECARISIMLGSTAIFNNGSGGHKQDFEDAVELYEAAIQSARTHGFLQYEVLGLELFGLFWLTAPARSKDHVACGYLVEAVFACERWGAHAKAQRIRSIYAPVLTSGGQFGVAGMKLNKHKSVFTSNNTFSADLETVVQASQAIAKEVEITQLIAKMTKVIVETSGAQKATLFIYEEESNKLVVS